MVRNPEDPARQRGRSADAVGLFEDAGRLAGIRRRDRCEHRSTAAADDDELGALVPVLAHAPYPFSMKSSRLRWKLITAISCRGLCLAPLTAFDFQLGRAHVCTPFT